MKRTQSETSQGGASTQKGGNSPTSSGSEDQKGTVPGLNLTDVQMGNFERTSPSSGSGRSSSTSSPEAQEGTQTKKSSGGKGSQEVADSEHTIENAITFIVDACENVGAENYDKDYLMPVYEALNVTAGSLVSTKLARICNSQKKEGGETCLHRAAQHGALEIVKLLLANGFAQYLNSEQKLVDQTPLSYAVGNIDNELIELFFNLSPKEVSSQSKNRIDHHNHLLCAAIFFYEESRKKIERAEKVDQLIQSAEFQKGVERFNNQEALSCDLLYLWYQSALEYGLLSAHFERDESEALLLELGNLLGSFSQDKFRDWYSNGKLPTQLEFLGDTSQLEEFCRTHGLENTAVVCEIYYEKSQYETLLSKLPTEFSKHLPNVLAKNEKERESKILVERKRVLDWLLNGLQGSLSLLGSGWPYSLSPLQMCARYRDKEYFRIILSQLPQKAPQDLPEVGKTDQNGNNLLHLAVTNADLSIQSEEDFIKFILKGYSELWNKVNNEDQSPLCIASLERNLPLIQLMAEQKKEIKVTQKYIAGQLLQQGVVQALSEEFTKTGGNKLQCVTEEEKIQESKIRLQLNGHRFPVDKKVEHGKYYTTPLEDAANLGNDDVVALLLNLWPDESPKILTKTTESPYLIALNQERSALLGSLEEDSKYQNAGMEWSSVLDKIIRFLHRSDLENGKYNTRKNFVSGLFSAIRTEIKEVQDSNLQQSLSHMTDQLQSDYQRVITEVQTNKKNEYMDEDILMINKIFYLLNELNVLASVTKMKDLSPGQLQKAKENFERSCSAKLYSETAAAHFTVVLWAFIGFAVGALVGLMLGTLLTAGGPGGIWLALPSAQYGSAVGAIVGSVIGAIVGGVSCVKVSDAYKWQRGLWAVNSAVNPIKAEAQIHDESNQLLLNVKN